MMLTREAIAEQLIALPDAIAAAERSYTAAEAEREEFEASLILSGLPGKNEMERKAKLTIESQQFEAEVNRQRVELHRLQNQLAALRSVARVIGGGDG